MINEKLGRSCLFVFRLAVVLACVALSTNAAMIPTSVTETVSPSQSGGVPVVYYGTNVVFTCAYYDTSKSPSTLIPNKNCGVFIDGVYQAATYDSVNQVYNYPTSTLSPETHTARCTCGDPGGPGPDYYQTSLSSPLSYTITAIPTSLTASVSPSDNAQVAGTDVTFECDYEDTSNFPSTPVTGADCGVYINGVGHTTTYSSGKYTYSTNSLSEGDNKWTCSCSETGYTTQTTSAQDYYIGCAASCGSSILGTVCGYALTPQLSSYYDILGKNPSPQIYYDTYVNCSAGSGGTATDYTEQTINIHLNGAVDESVTDHSVSTACSATIFCGGPGSCSDSLTNYLSSPTKQPGDTVVCEVDSLAKCNLHGLSTNTLTCYSSPVYTVQSYPTQVLVQGVPANSQVYGDPVQFQCNYQYQKEGTWSKVGEIAAAFPTCEAWMIQAGSSVDEGPMTWDAANGIYEWPSPATSSLPIGTYWFTCICSTHNDWYARVQGGIWYSINPITTGVSVRVTPVDASHSNFACYYGDIAHGAYPVFPGWLPISATHPASTTVSHVPSATCQVFADWASPPAATESATQPGEYDTVISTPSAGTHKWWCECSATNYETTDSNVYLYVPSIDYSHGVCFGHSCNVTFPQVEVGVQSYSKDDPMQEVPTRYPLNGTVPTNVDPSSLLVIPLLQTGPAFITLVGLNQLLQPISGSANLGGGKANGVFTAPGPMEVVPSDQSNRLYEEINAISGSGNPGDYFNVSTDYQVNISLFNITSNSTDIANFVKYPLVDLSLDMLPLSVSSDSDHSSNPTDVTILGMDTSGNLVSESATLNSVATTKTSFGGVSFENLYVVDIKHAVPGETIYISTISTASRVVDSVPIPPMQENVTSKQYIAQILPNTRPLEIYSNDSGFRGMIVGTYGETTPQVAVFNTPGSSVKTAVNFTNLIAVYLTGSSPNQLFEIKTAPLNNSPNEQVGTIQVLVNEFGTILYMNDTGTYVFGSMDKFELNIPDNSSLGNHNFSYIFYDKFNNSFVIPYGLYLRLPTATTSDVQAARDAADGNLTHVTFHGKVLYTRLDEPNEQPTHALANQTVMIFINNLTEDYKPDPPLPLVLPSHQYGWLENITTNDSGEFNGSFDIRGWGSYYIISLFNGTPVYGPSVSIKSFYGGGIAVAFGNPQVAVPIIIILISVFIRKDLRRIKGKI